LHRGNHASLLACAADNKIVARKRGTVGLAKLTDAASPHKIKSQLNFAAPRSTAGQLTLDKVSFIHRF
jgi:hypothetical protein